jgi:two-component sensor histidine kinase
LKIRTQLFAGIIFFALILALISGLVIATNQQVSHLDAEEAIANSIALDVGELGYLSNDYILYREPQQADRWNSKFASISDAVSRLSVDPPEQKAIVRNLAANLKNSQSVFDDIVAGPVAPGGAETGYIQLSWSRMAVQNQGMIFDAGRLAKLIRAQADEVERTRNLLIFALMGSFGALLLISYYVGARRMLRSLASLQHGAGIVGRGDFNHTIDVQSNDEIEELGQSFNRMTLNLRKVTARKEDLEREVAERRRVEADLEQKNQELNRANEALAEIHEELKGANDELLANGQLLVARNEELSCLNEELIATQDDLHRHVGELNEREQALRQSGAELEHALAEKEVLLSEIHHRVKNNLTAFISLLSLDGSIEDTPGGKTLRQDLQNRARSMALIHETLYKTHKFAEVDIRVYLTTLVEQIVNSYDSPHSFRMVIDIEEISLDIGRATPMGLIINELVTNSLKYAFPPELVACRTNPEDPCTIGMRMTEEEGSYRLIVFDNGIGLPAGFDLQTTKTLGLKLVNFLAKHQLRATVEVNPGPGTEFIFRFGK